MEIDENEEREEYGRVVGGRLRQIRKQKALVVTQDTPLTDTQA